MKGFGGGGPTVHRTILQNHSRSAHSNGPIIYLNGLWVSESVGRFYEVTFLRCSRISQITTITNVRECVRAFCVLTANDAVIRGLN